MSTSQRTIPSPVPNAETAEFWKAGSEGRFLLRHCTDCDRSHWYPRTICPHCFGANTDWREASGQGVLYSFSTMRRADPPFTLAYVTLAEGPSMMTNIVDCDPDTLAIGQPVRLKWTPSADGQVVPTFVPA